MRKILLATLTLAAVSAVAAFAFNPDKMNKITFHNATGRKIEMIFLSPADSKLWGPDIMGANYFLGDTRSIGYYVHYPDTSFKFDIMAIDEMGNELEIRDFQLVDGKESRVRLVPESLKKAAADFTLVTVHIRNRTGREMQYLFISPSDSKAWGVDLLDETTTVTDGDTYSFVLAVGRDTLRYNLMAVVENNDEYQFTFTIDPKTRKELTWAVEPGDLNKAK